MQIITSVRSLRGNDRLISGQVKIGDSCAAQGLFSNENGNKIPCSHELVAADPRHLTGAFTTLCTAHLPYVENDLDDLWADGHSLGFPPTTDRTDAPGGLEENYRLQNIEKEVGAGTKGKGKKKKFFFSEPDEINSVILNQLIKNNEK
jgi:hypothetical protein